MNSGRNDSRPAYYMGKLHRISHSETRVYAPAPSARCRRSPNRQVVCVFFLTIWYTFLSSSNPDAQSSLHFCLILRNVRTGVFKGPRPSQC